MSLKLIFPADLQPRLILQQKTMLQVLANIVLFSGLGALGYSLYMRRKQSFYQQLFKDLQKCPKYHLDYVDKIDQLPSNKTVILFGTARSLSNEKIIAKTYIKKNDQQNRLWNYEFKDKFNLATAANQLVEIEPVTDADVMAFNLPKINQDLLFEERVIHHNEPVCVYGNISIMGDNGRRIKPLMLMGTKQEKLLQFLDIQMLKVNKKGRYSVIAGTALFGIHFTYQILWGKKARREEKMKLVFGQNEQKK